MESSAHTGLLFSISSTIRDTGADKRFTTTPYGIWTEHRVRLISMQARDNETPSNTAHLPKLRAVGEFANPVAAP